MRFAIVLALLMSAPAWAAPAPAAKATPAPAVAKATPAPAAAQPNAEKPRPKRDMGKWMTIVGEVMCPACFLEAGEKSISTMHFQCALDCAKAGQTLALYNREEDRIYFVAGEFPAMNPNAQLMPYIHKKVDVSGTVFVKAGVHGIVINKIVPHAEKAVAPAK